MKRLLVIVLFVLALAGCHADPSQVPSASPAGTPVVAKTLLPPPNSTVADVIDTPEKVKDYILKLNPTQGNIFPSALNATNDTIKLLDKAQTEPEMQAIKSYEIQVVAMGGPPGVSSVNKSCQWIETCVDLKMAGKDYSDAAAQARGYADKSDKSIPPTSGLQLAPPH